MIRYFRSRLGDRGDGQGRGQGGAISVVSGSRIILDHFSASWSVDETPSASARYEDAKRTEGIYDLTVQWSIISETLRRAGHARRGAGRA